MHQKFTGFFKCLWNTLSSSDNIPISTNHFPHSYITNHAGSHYFPGSLNEVRSRYSAILIVSSAPLTVHASSSHIYRAPSEGNERDETHTGLLSPLIISLETKTDETEGKLGSLRNFLLSDMDILLVSARKILPYEQKSLAFYRLFLFHTNV